MEQRCKNAHNHLDVKTHSNLRPILDNLFYTCL